MPAVQWLLSLVEVLRRLSRLVDRPMPIDLRSEFSNLKLFFQTSKLLKPGCALPFASGPQTRSSILQSATRLYRNQLVPAVLVADFIRVDGSSRTARNRANHCALLSADQTTEKRATHRAPRGSDLVTVLLPNGSVLPVVVVVINVVAIDVVAVGIVAVGIVAVGVFTIPRVAIVAGVVNCATVVS